MAAVTAGEGSRLMKPLQDLVIGFRDLIPAPLLPALVLDEVHGLAHGDYHQDSPKIVTVLQARKLALLDSLAEAVEGAAAPRPPRQRPRAVNRPVSAGPGPPCGGNSVSRAAGLLPGRRLETRAASS